MKIAHLEIPEEKTVLANIGVQGNPDETVANQITANPTNTVWRRPPGKIVGVAFPVGIKLARKFVELVAPAHDDNESRKTAHTVRAEIPTLAVQRNQKRGFGQSSVESG